MQFEELSWAKRSRLAGAMRYHSIWLGKLVGWVLIALLGVQVLTLLMAALGVGKMRASGVSSDFATTLVLALVCAVMMANNRTRFLLRFGTPRLSVWLSSLLALFAGMVVFLLGTLLISLLSAGAVLALSGVMPDRFALASYYSSLPTGGALLGYTLRETLIQLPNQLLWTLEWVSLSYLLGVCLRRKKGVTLAVVIGVPFALFMLMLVPAINETIAALENGSQSNLMFMGLQWVQWLSKAANFVRMQWQWIQLGAAVAALPLSYLCMRGTAQP